MSSDPEDGLDGCDNDGDMSTAVERLYINTMDAAVVGSGFAFTLPLGAGTPVGGVTINQGGVAERRMAFKYTLPFLTGEFTVVVDVDADTTSGGCSIDVLDSGSGTCTGTLGPGTNVIACPSIGTNTTIQKLDVVCATGTHAITLDWLAVQNGPYIFAPMVDQNLAVQGTRAPSGGAMVVTRTDEYRDLMFAGSNVGGFAWSDDGESWTTANGRAQDLDSHDSLGVFEILAWDDDDDIFTDPVMFIQTGFQYSSGGGMFRSDDLGSSWEPADEGQSLGTFKLVDDCGNNGGASDGEASQEGKNVSSGKTLLLERSDGGPDPRDIIYIAAGEELSNGAVAIPGKRGIWIKELDAGGAVCQPYAPETLPTSANSAVGINAIPSALALANVAEGSNELDWYTHLLVGYRVVAGGPGWADRTALYLCPSVQHEGWVCGDEPLECEPVVDGTGEDLTSAILDVRDIEPIQVDPSANYGLPTFAIAHGGRRAKPVDPAECWDPGETIPAAESPESTVLILELNQGSSSPVMDLWDTDSDAVEPSWALDTSGAQANYVGTNGADGCIPGPLEHSGELVAPGSVAAGSLSSLIVDPDSQYLFAMYPQGPGVLVYGCVRVFRTEVASLAEGGSDWMPLQDWVAGAMGGGTIAGHTAPTETDYGPNAEQRREGVDLRGSYFAETGRSDVLAPGWAVDGEFVDVGGERVEYSLFVGGSQLWLLEAANIVHFGWDTVRDPTHDMDHVAWTLAFGGEGYPAFQDVLVNDVGACHGCDSDRDIVFAANQDVKYYRTFGPVGDVPADEAADAPCAFEKTSVGGTVVDAGRFVDPDTEAEVNVVWFGGHSQVDTEDTTAIRALSVSLDGGDSYCWDRAEGLNKGEFYHDDLGWWALECSDRDWVGDEEFVACDEAITPDLADVSHMDDATDPGVGTVKAIKVINARRALLVATTACVDSTGSACNTLGGGGLFIATLDPGFGIAYQHVPTDSVAWSNSGSGCADENARFSASSDPHLWVHPDTDWEAGGTARVYLSLHASSTCAGGLAEVTFDVDDPEDSGTTYWRFDTLASGLGNWAATTNLWAMAGSPDGDRVLLGGAGVQNVSMSPTVEYRNFGWLTSIELDLPWPPSASSIVTWTRAIVIPAVSPTGAPTFPFLIDTILAHPHLNGQWYFGGYPATSCPTCKPSGVYGLQRWWNPGAGGGAGGWSWGWTKVSDNTFENGRLLSMTWGNDPSNALGTDMSELYLGTLGSGLAQGAFSW